MSPALAQATWWSIADADPTLLGIVVGVVAIAALAVVGHRVWSRRR